MDLDLVEWSRAIAKLIVRANRPEKSIYTKSWHLWSHPFLGNDVIIARVKKAVATNDFLSGLSIFQVTVEKTIEKTFKNFQKHFLKNFQ
jgi:hypothetical protein